MTAPFRPLAEDVSVRSNDLSEAPGLPLVAILRNERQLLPDFLAHYRALGVRRFFLLDDASDDGSAAFLDAQPDVCHLVSSRRYGDTPERSALPAPLQALPDLRMIHVWRTGLMNRFCAGQWALHCDLDEFVALPEGMTLQAVIARVEATGAQGVWGGMIDLYPPNIEDLWRYPETGFVFPNQPWYFDGARHFSLRRGKPPRHHYVGVRHRLDVAFAGKRDLTPWAKARLRVLGRRKAPSGTLVKPILQRWTPGAFYFNSHRTTLALSDGHLLPLLHYRYSPAVVSKLDWALSSGGYSKGNSDYARLTQMLGTMRSENASFLAPNSRQVAGFDSFVKTGNARL